MSQVTFEELLARDGRLVYKTRGVSMEPMLRQNRDLVVVQVPSARLRKYDVALYRRGGMYILHRVVKVCDGYYLIRGDNTYSLERVPDSAVIGVLTAFERKGKHYEATDPGYRCYARIRTALYPLRKFRLRAVRVLKRIARRLGIAPLLKKLLRRA